MKFGKFWFKSPFNRIKFSKNWGLTEVYNGVQKIESNKNDKSNGEKFEYFYWKLNPR